MRAMLLIFASWKFARRSIELKMVKRFCHHTPRGNNSKFNWMHIYIYIVNRVAQKSCPFLFDLHFRHCQPIDNWQFCYLKIYNHKNYIIIIGTAIVCVEWKGESENRKGFFRIRWRTHTILWLNFNFSQFCQLSASALLFRAAENELLGNWSTHRVRIVQLVVQMKYVLHPISHNRSIRCVYILPRDASLPISLFRQTTDCDTMAASFFHSMALNTIETSFK